MSNFRADSKPTPANVPGIAPRRQDAQNEARTAQDRAAPQPSAKDPLDVELYNLPFTD